MNEYDYVKEFGEGIDRIYRDTAEAGLPEPEFKQSEFMFYATLKNKNWGKDDVTWVVSTQDTIQDAIQDKNKLIIYCSEPKSRQEMMKFMGLENRQHFVKRYLHPLLAEGKLVMTIPDKPNSKNQKYVARQ